MTNSALPISHTQKGWDYSKSFAAHGRSGYSVTIIPSNTIKSSRLLSLIFAHNFLILIFNSHSNKAFRNVFKD